MQGCLRRGRVMKAVQSDTTEAVKAEPHTEQAAGKDKTANVVPRLCQYGYRVDLACHVSYRMSYTSFIYCLFFFIDIDVYLYLYLYLYLCIHVASYDFMAYRDIT